MEKERAHNALRTHEKDLGDMQIREVNLKSQIKDRTTLEKQVGEMKAQVTAASQSSKVRAPPILRPLLDRVPTEPSLP